MQVITELEPTDGDVERFAEELAEDLRGTRVDVAWLMCADTAYLVRREDDDESE